MYNFKDTTDNTAVTQNLPSEAFMIDGVYLENVIDGYRTLYVKGREALSPELEFGTVGIRDGSYFKTKRFPHRELTVGYQIVAGSNADFITAFQKLNEVLDVEDATLIFADETDKYLIGTPSGYGEIPEGRLSVKGEFQIICADPFKYSLTEYEVTPTLDDGATFLVDYQGTYPAYPVLQTNFYSSATQNDTHGDCGFVAFSTQNADVLQFGKVSDPEEITNTVSKLVDSTTTTWTESKCLINEAFDSLTWTANSGYTGSIYYLDEGTPNVAYINNGTDKALYCSNYGSGKQWHGATVSEAIPNDGGNPSVTGAVDWKLHGTLRFASSKTAKTAKKQSGLISIAVTDANGKALAGCSIFKKKGSNKGTVSMLCNNKAVKKFTKVDLSYYNKFFGYKKKSKDKRPCNFDITKSGNKFTFNIGGKKFSYKLASLASAQAKNVSIYIADWGEQSAVSWMAVYSCQFTSTSVTQTKTTETWEELTEIIEQEHAFTTNDILVCDCSDGSIRMMNAYATEDTDGGLHPELGALGNDWESFVLTKGTNQIGTMYSDWVTDAYKPTFTLRYRERFL